MCDFPHSAIIGIESELIAESNDRRTGLFVRNLSDNTISFGFDHPAELNNGVTLFAKESFSMTPNDYSAADVYVIASAADTQISFQEFSSRSVD